MSQHHNLMGKRAPFKRRITMAAMAVLVLGGVAALVTIRAIPTKPTGGRLLTDSTNTSNSSSESTCQGPLPAMANLAHATVQAPQVTLSALPAGTTTSYASSCRFPNDTFVQVSLPGVANADTVPSGGIPVGVSQSQVGAYHPASYVTVTVVGGASAPPPTQPTVSDPPPDYTVSTIDLHGQSATAWYPSDGGLGGYNIAWVEDGDYVQVQTTRGQTDDGESGVSLSELEDVAGGLHLG